MGFAVTVTAIIRPKNFTTISYFVISFEFVVSLILEYYLLRVMVIY